MKRTLLIAMMAAASLFGDVADAAEADMSPAGAKATLRWTATMDEGTYGYIVLRASSADGPWLRVNPELIRRDPEASAPRHYVFVDESVKRGDTYWYRIESVAVSGVKKYLASPIRKSVE